MPRRFLAILAATLWAAAASAAGTFFNTVEDMPLMPGLAEAPGASTVFDKAGGAYRPARGQRPGPGQPKS